MKPRRVTSLEEAFFQLVCWDCRIPVVQDKTRISCSTCRLRHSWVRNRAPLPVFPFMSRNNKAHFALELLGFFEIFFLVLFFQKVIRYLSPLNESKYFGSGKSSRVPLEAQPKTVPSLNGFACSKTLWITADEDRKKSRGTSRTLACAIWQTIEIGEPRDFLVWEKMSTLFHDMESDFAMDLVQIRSGNNR